jgi:hypothetical protein
MPDEVFHRFERELDSMSRIALPKLHVSLAVASREPVGGGRSKSCFFFYENQDGSGSARPRSVSR